jgi:hypothetical protein
MDFHAAHEGEAANGATVDAGQAANRLQITADVDVAGLEKLEKMLAKYKEILKMQ